MTAYNKELHYQSVLQQDKLGLDPCQAKGLGPVCSQIKKTALDNLIDAVLIRDYAGQHHITVPQSSFRRQWAIIYKQDFHNQAAVLKAYAKRFGFTSADVKDKTREQMLQDAVMLSLTKNIPQTAPAVRLSKIDVKSQAEVQMVKQALSSGQSFNSVAAKLDKNKKTLCSQVGCGDMGWLPNSFVPAGDRQVLTAPVGTVVGPFAGSQMLELLKVTGRKTHYSLTTQQILRFRQQKLISWLKHQESSADIKRYVSG